MVPVNGTFYVGLLQYNQYMLNIGMDINKPANGNILYNLGSEWLVSAAPGNLMLRPFVQRSYSSSKTLIQEPSSVRVWPNPANEFLRLELPFEIEENDIQIAIFDITGKMIRSSGGFQQEIYTGDLPEGIYLLTLKSETRLFSTERIIIRR